MLGAMKQFMQLLQAPRRSARDCSAPLHARRFAPSPAAQAPNGTTADSQRRRAVREAMGCVDHPRR
jgi:hypothetical protein